MPIPMRIHLSDIMTSRPPPRRYGFLFLFLYLLSSAPANTLETTLARSFIKNYGKNEARLASIEHELEALPLPYMRDPTGTGGFLTHAKTNASDEVVIHFEWETPVKLDAFALFPLRLFMDEIYAENLYWPGRITIEARVNNRVQVLTERTNSPPLIRQSLPELIKFDPVVTGKLTIRCTDLPQHPYEKWHAGGFAEIFIFSGPENVAPRASCSASWSRQGYYVLAKEFLTDAQTPLGLPERSSRSKTHDFIKIMGTRTEAPTPYALTLVYPEPIPVDAVRIDPAIQHAYGQSFPVRFTIDLLDDQGRVIKSHNKYKHFPFRNPGLNPYLAYFPLTQASAVRLTVLQASRPVQQTVPAIAFSEITPMAAGKHHARPAAIEEQFQGNRTRVELNTPQDTDAKRILASACDGRSQSGRILPQREWVEGLVLRQQLMEEQMVLRELQKRSLVLIQKTLVRGSIILIFLAIGSTLFFVIRSRNRTHRGIRLARAKIASDLHDDVGSNLGSIILHVEKLQEENKTLNAQERLKSIYRLTRESVFGLREVLHASAPEVGRSQDIIAYMRELAGLLLGKTCYTFEVAPSLSEKLSENALRKGLLLFYKEALFNAKTHADCSQIDIVLRIENRTLVLNIKDNGQGIDAQELKKARTLRTLKQRAKWLHANLQIQSEPGTGTELTLSISTDSTRRVR